MKYIFNIYKIYKLGILINIHFLDPTNTLKTHAVTQTIRMSGRPSYNAGISGKIFQLCFSSILWKYKMFKM